MASLRARVLVSVLALAAAGLIALAAVTYTEQRSFLQGRLDDEVRSAEPAVAQLLDSRGFRPSGAPPAGTPRPGLDGGGGGTPGAGQGQGPPNPNLPLGTYGQRRDASGRVIGGAPLFSDSQSSKSKQPEPKLPAQIAVGRFLTVGSKGSSSQRYRVYASDDARDAGVTVVAVPMSDVEATLHRLLLVELLVIVGVLAALGASAFFVVRIGLRPLDRIEATAGQIAAGDLSRRVSPATSRTEVGRLGLALNAMLERLEQAFAARSASEERLRRFLADASHELRTPLASIRSYAELHRMGANEDTTLAMRRIEEESTRMGMLVEDLLTLARLDEQPQRGHEQVDLARLATDAVADARATAPEREISLRAPEPALLVRGDAPQLRQVFANLLRNALVHTPTGTAVEVELQPAANDILLVVRDHGPGISPEARTHLFDRFWRAGTGRERGPAGSGLGLSIVAAIVDAHDGEIAVADAPGGGARFEISLPQQPPS
ncbi:MAG TPA: HAMP domain-containing sensor histidine kinase [Solirubrobacteraceae bacterium]|jgi:two-component system OmpR family sensor kinase